MNELRGLFAENPSWPSCFEESDRMVVESLVRLAREGVSGEMVTEVPSEALILALLLLVRSVRLEHVALDLAQPAIAQTLELAGVLSGPDSTELISALLQRSDPWTRYLVDVVNLGDAVVELGLPIVVATQNGVAAFGYLRRMAHCEWRVANALWRSSSVESTTTLDGLLISDNPTVTSPNRAVTEVLKRLDRHRISVVTGGPGTGKTTAIAGVLRELAQRRRAVGATTALRVALCAPTAKAAVRLRDAVSTSFAAAGERLSDFDDVLSIDERSGSVHRLLGLRADRVVAPQLLAVDLVIVDEVSMLELPLLDQLLVRVGGTSRVVLVGDPDQLASVNVGAALSDLVDAADVNGPLAPLVTRLVVNYRSVTALVDFAAAANDGDLVALRTIANAHPETIELARDRQHTLSLVHEVALERFRAAQSAVPGAALDALSRHAVLCATREGPGSVAWWSERVAPSIAARGEIAGPFVLGAPVLVTRNETAVRGELASLANGDLGVVIVNDDRLEVEFGPITAPRRRAFGQLPQCEAAWAMTIHKSQGSEYSAVVVSLPDRDSPILTRELLYTAITRARHKVTVLANDEILASTLARRIDRVSGIAARLNCFASTGTVATE